MATDAAEMQNVFTTFTGIHEEFTENEEALKIINDVLSPKVFDDDISLESGHERFTG